MNSGDSMLSRMNRINNSLGASTTLTRAARWLMRRRPLRRHARVMLAVPPGARRRGIGVKVHIPRSVIEKENRSYLTTKLGWPHAR